MTSGGFPAPKSPCWHASSRNMTTSLAPCISYGGMPTWRIGAIIWIRVHYVILTSSPLEDPTVVGWPKKVIFQPTSGGVPDGPGSRSLL